MDFPIALKNARNVLCLDMERFFLRGVEDPSHDFLKNCYFSKDDISSFRVQDADHTEFAQMQYGGNSAALFYDIPFQSSNSSKLMEALCQIAGEAGKFHLLANVPADGDQWQYLKMNGFRTYSIQTIYKMNPLPFIKSSSVQWCFETDEDRDSIASFYSRFLSPLEASIQSWNFPDIFHLILHDHSACIRGITRVRFFANRAVLLPMLDANCSDPEQHLAALLHDCSRYFSTIFLREFTNRPFNKEIFGNAAEVCLLENHFMVRNLASFNTVKNFQLAEYLDDKGIAKPSTPFSHS
ncbi:MAG: hypothetical protein ACYC59_00440 [Anaerolineaceae bacterium]